jgi:hypothetical protein
MVQPFLAIACNVTLWRFNACRPQPNFHFTLDQGNVPASK